MVDDGAAKAEQPNLSTLLYVSENVVARMGGVVDEELNRILKAARRNNPLLGVTGALLLSHSHFAQVLEGPSPAVEEIFRTIADDPRHRNVVVLRRERVAARSFPEWSMAFVQERSDPADLREAGTTLGEGSDLHARRLAATLFDLIALHQAQAGEAFALPSFDDEL